MNLSSIFSAMIQLFLILIVGWVGHKTKVFPAETQTALTKLVVYITTPCTILYSVLNNSSLPGIGVMVELLLVSSACYIAVAALSLLAVKLMRIRPGSRGAYVCMLLFTNCGFIGFPVVQAIFGADAVFYASILNIPFYPCLYTLGVYLLSKDAADRGLGQAEIALSWRTFVSPCMVASVAAVVLALTGLKFPAVLTNTIGTIGNITTPGALLVIGISIAKQPLREMLGSAKIYLMSALRLIVLPVLIWFVLHFFLRDQTILGVIVVTFAMPTATMVSMLADEYGSDQRAAVQGVFLTTLFSMVTIPLLMAALMAG